MVQTVDLTEQVRYESCKQSGVHVIRLPQFLLVELHCMAADWELKHFVVDELEVEL